jgi:poly(3-hydroxybutyrate) depolymerase
MKIRHAIAMFVAALLSSGVVSTQADDVKPGEQTAQTFEKQITVKLDYLLDLPADYEKTPDKKWPLIFFLHGSGERGSNVQKVAAHGPPRLLGADADKIDHSDKRNKDATDIVDVDEAKSKEAQAALKNFIVVSPQLPQSESGWQPFALNAMLDDILAKYHVDHDRVYLTGLSMGGYGTWQWASQNPGRFAAIAPATRAEVPAPCAACLSGTSTAKPTPRCRFPKVKRWLKRSRRAATRTSSSPATRMSATIAGASPTAIPNSIRGSSPTHCSIRAAISPARQSSLEFQI